jgi:hypothetical protein
MQGGGLAERTWPRWLRAARLFGLGRSQIDAAEQPGPPFREADDGKAQQPRGMWLTGVGIGLAGAGLASVATAIVLATRSDGDDRKPEALTYSISPTQIAIHGAF